MAGRPGSPRHMGPGGSMAYVLVLTLVAALGGLLFGYDTAVIAGAIDFLEIRFELGDWSKGWAVSSILVGCMMGAALAGTLSDRFGRRRVLLLSAVLFAVSAIGSAIPRNLTEFVAARMLGGFGVGMASMLSPLYIAEVAPARMRGRLVSLNQVAIISGMLVVSIVNYFIGGYGASLDRRAIAPRIAEHGPTLDPERTAAFLQRSVKHSAAVDLEDRESAEAFEQDMRQFLEAHAERLEPQAVVDFLKGYEVKVDQTDVHLANFGLVSWNVSLGWRWMFASETLPATLLLLLLFFVPESPRWLTKQGREAEALTVLARVNGLTRAEYEMKEIKETIALEGGSFWEIFRRGIRVALLIAVVLAILQQVTGINAVLYYAPGIFTSSGAEVTATQALLQTVALQVVNLMFTLVAIWVVDRGGRKPLLLITSAAMGISLVLLGGAFHRSLAPVWVFAFTLAYVASFAVAMGPVVWVVLSEIFPTRTRGRAMGVATVSLWIACFAVSQTVPWMFKHLGHPATFWTYAVMCLVAFFFVLAFVPETKGRTLEEIERSWMR